MNMHVKMNKKGFTLLELLVGIAMISIASLVIAGLASYTSVSSNNLGQGASILNVKSQILSLVDDREAWAATLAQNSNVATPDAGMGCLAFSRDCRIGGVAASGTLDIYDASGNLFYKSSDPVAGFALDGSVCNAYSATSSACPLKYTLSWKALCPPAGACNNPVVSITGVLAHSSAIASNINVDSNFSVSHAVTMNTVNRNCLALGGVLDPATRLCKRGAVTFSCPAGEMITGVDASGNIVCGFPFAGNCKANQLFVGVDATTETAQCVDSDIQLSIRNPATSNKPKKIDCNVVDKVEGNVWLSYYVDEEGDVNNCGPNPDDGSYNKLFEIKSEMTCKQGFVVPTGRSTRTDTGKVVGSCAPAVCPAGIKSGQYYWKVESSNVERFTCGGGDLTRPGMTRKVTFQIEAQHYCLDNVDISTGLLRKSEISRTPCPPGM